MPPADAEKQQLPSWYDTSLKHASGLQKWALTNLNVFDSTGSLKVASQFCLDLSIMFVLQPRSLRQLYFEDGPLQFQDICSV